ncbi:hypothetical protein WA026_004559 [Henosepilachna vigintioctopunctata]|uniref:BESS domain-containing protein n=1 Tax=Henosepilachna vigintioctopunctata TaxID=420089 RepID=A0AAW1VB57_9CUCU
MGPNLQPQSFPTLPNHTRNINISDKPALISVPDRRNLIHNEPSTSSYVSVAKRRKVPQNVNPGYDKEVHQSQLIRLTHSQNNPANILMNNSLNKIVNENNMFEDFINMLTTKNIESHEIKLYKSLLGIIKAKLNNIDDVPNSEAMDIPDCSLALTKS